MGNIKSPLNFFSESEKKNKKKTENPITDSSTQVTENIQNTGPNASRINNVNPFIPVQPQPMKTYITPPTIAAMLEKMNQMQQEIEDKIDEAVNKNGITRAQLNEYLNNPKNFTPEQFKFLKQSEEFISQRFWTAISKTTHMTRLNAPVKATAPTGTATASVTTASPSTAKRGKVKSAGTRRKWINTR